jgi:hypothetical protein
MHKPHSTAAIGVMPSGSASATVGWLIHTLPTTLLYPITSPTHFMRLSDFYIFGLIEQQLVGKQFVTEADMKQSPLG